MMSRHLRHLPALFPYLLLLLFISGCAAPRSWVVLLPEDGEPSGAVVITTAEGTEVLSGSWEKSEISGMDAPPGAPVRVQGMAAQSEVLKALSALPPQPAHFTLFFEFGSTELAPESRRLLPHIVQSVQQRAAAEVAIVGHTDTVAGEGYNFLLGARRAEKVRSLLKGMGVAPARWETASRGEGALLVYTPDGTAEPRNRRAEVTVR